MPAYRVRFLKRVVDGRGRERQICQRVVEVQAKSLEAALGPARELFCSLERIPHWSIRSDSYEAKMIEVDASRTRSGRRTRSKPRSAQVSRQRPVAEVNC
jgi:hypothetical protein